MDVKQASKKAKEAIDRMTWTAKVRADPFVKEEFSGTTDDGWICLVIRSDGRDKGKVVPVFDGVIAHPKTKIDIRMTEEMAERAMHIARKQLEKH